MLEVIAYLGMVLWLSVGVFVLYTAIRDDIRSEKDRKEKMK